MTPAGLAAGGPLPLYLQPGRIGSLTLRNRIVRAATSETMAEEDGAVTDQLVGFYERLSAGGAGLLVTGHIYVDPRGQCSPRQMGLYDDRLVPGFRRLTDAVHRHGGAIFAEISHAGSQCMMSAGVPLAPSAVVNPIYERNPDVATEEDIAHVIAAFASAARRAREAGFDGVHIHGGNGYLIAEFGSPHANRRDDRWGGDAEGRGRFARSVYAAVRAAVGPDFPVSMRLGVMDSVPHGLTLEEGIDRAVALAEDGVDALELTYAVMDSYRDNIRPYVAVDGLRALRDWAIERLWTPPAPQAYYRTFAKKLKARADVPVILVGGLRSTDMMDEVLSSGSADFLAFARPFIREPGFPNMLAAGRRGQLDCVSCNICLAHDGYDPLKCWRLDPADLWAHGRQHLSSLFSR